MTGTSWCVAVAAVVLFGVLGLRAAQKLHEELQELRSGELRRNAAQRLLEELEDPVEEGVPMTKGKTDALMGAQFVIALGLGVAAIVTCFVRPQAPTPTEMAVLAMVTLNQLYLTSLEGGQDQRRDGHDGRDDLEDE